MLRLIRRSGHEPQFVRPKWVPTLLFELLSARGINSEAEMVEFLSPLPEHMHDPFAFEDMECAVALIHAVKQENAMVCVYGDYDVDGVCATAILCSALSNMGIAVKPYIPSRHGEGYGLNETALEEICQWAGLIITVDCGITSVKEVALCNERKLPIIVTDHHRPGIEQPDCPILNPTLGDYPFPSLCGAGVALKLAMALDPMATEKYIDLAALATVADLVPLVGENRTIVSLGLEAIRKEPRLGLRALADAAGIELSTLRAGTIAFGLAPRLNAGGRLGDAKRPLKLLMTDDPQDAKFLARELETENAERREIEREIMEDAHDKLARFDFLKQRIIILHGSDWNSGVIGLAASRIVEKYHMPAIMLSGEGPLLTGSCRSIPGIDIHKAITACDRWLTRYGGHKMAAGLTIPLRHLEEFSAALNEHLLQNVDDALYVPSTEYDLEADIAQLDGDMVRGLGMMEPFGFGNPTPVILTRAQVMNARAVGTDGTHLSLRLKDDDGEQMSAIGFRMAGRLHQMKGYVRLLHQPKLNEYQGRVSVQLELKAMATPDPFEILCAAEPNWNAMLHAYLTERVYNWAYSCKSEPIRRYEGSAHILQLLSGYPYGTLVVATDLQVLSEFIDECRAAKICDQFLLLMGEWPKDGKRPFNAICAAPRGQMPQGYERVVMLDAPGALMGTDVPVWEPERAKAQWLGELPDVDALRRLYLRLRELLKLPLVMRDVGALLSSLEGDGAAAALGLPVLGDMGLIDYRPHPLRLAMLPPKKADPRENRVYLRLHSLYN